MSMSKKDFIALADAIKRHNDGMNETGNKHLLFDSLHIAVLAQFCQSQNANFNRDRWLGYIAGTNGPSGGSVK